MAIHPGALNHSVADLIDRYTKTAMGEFGNIFMDQMTGKSMTARGPIAVFKQKGNYNHRSHRMKIQSARMRSYTRLYPEPEQDSVDYTTRGETITVPKVITGTKYMYVKIEREVRNRRFFRHWHRVLSFPDLDREVWEHRGYGQVTIRAGWPEGSKELKDAIWRAYKAGGFDDKEPIHQPSGWYNQFSDMVSWNSGAATLQRMYQATKLAPHQRSQPDVMITTATELSLMHDALTSRATRRSR